MGASKYPDLDLETYMPFGKYQSKRVVDVITTDPGYMMWLRWQRWHDELQVTVGTSTSKVVYGPGAGMSDNIHYILDDYIKGGGKGWKPGHSQLRWPDAPNNVAPDSSVVEYWEEPEVRDADAKTLVVAEEWGAWG